MGGEARGWVTRRASNGGQKELLMEGGGRGRRQSARYGAREECGDPGKLLFFKMGEIRAF